MMATQIRWGALGIIGVLTLVAWALFWNEVRKERRAARPKVCEGKECTALAEDGKRLCRECARQERAKQLKKEGE